MLVRIQSVLRLRHVDFNKEQTPHTNVAAEVTRLHYFLDCEGKNVSKSLGCQWKRFFEYIEESNRAGLPRRSDLVWSAEEVNQRKADRLPREAGLKLLSIPRAPKELPVSALNRNLAELEPVSFTCAEWSQVALLLK